MLSVFEVMYSLRMGNSCKRFPGFIIRLFKRVYFVNVNELCVLIRILKSTSTIILRLCLHTSFRDQYNISIDI